MPTVADNAVIEQDLLASRRALQSKLTLRKRRDPSLN